MSRWSAPRIVLIALGWGLWAVGLVYLLACEGLQSNPGISGPGDRCGKLRWIVGGGFVFLAFASILALPWPRGSEHESREAPVCEEGRSPAQRGSAEGR